MTLARYISIQMDGLSPRTLVEGETIRHKATLRDGLRNTGELVDPETVQVLVRPPSRPIDEDPLLYNYGGIEPVVDKVGTGIYSLDLTLDEPGEWIFRWEMGDDWTGVIEYSLSVRTSRVLTREPEDTP